jgi:pimeloyl-ACP methyl ester carboxylesterase
VKTLVLALALAACSSSAPPPVAKPAAPAFTPTAFSVKVSGTGRPVIFIPGLASPGDVWDGTVAHLGGKVQAHVLTLAGFAGQPPIAAPFMQQVHDQILQYIVANHLDHPVIIGHSLGGVMALWLGETAPQLGGIVDVDGLPFLAAMMDPSVTADKAAEGAAATRDQMLAAPHDAFVANMKQFIGSMASKPDSIAMLDAAAEKSDQTTVANAFAELMSKDLRADLPKIQVPAMVIAAGSMGMVTPDQLKTGWHAQIDAIPHVDFEVVDNAKHFVMLDQPEAFYALIDKALAAH